MQAALISFRRLGMCKLIKKGWGSFRRVLTDDGACCSRNLLLDVKYNAFRRFLDMEQFEMELL
jgi:hypothetical protein